MENKKTYKPMEKYTLEKSYNHVKKYLDNLDIEITNPADK